MAGLSDKAGRERGRMSVDYTIVSRPDYVSLACPHCKEDLRINFSEVDFNTDYWGDGAWVTCPYCEQKIELGNYEYE